MSDQPTDELVPKAEFDKLRKNAEILRRKLTQAQEGKINSDDLLKDPAFRSKALQTWEIPHDEEGNFKLPDNLKDQGAIEEQFKERLTKARSGWEKEFKPKLDLISNLENENNALKDDVLIASLERSAKKAGVVDSKFSPIPFGNGKVAPVHMARDRFKWNPELRAHVMMDGDNMALSNTGEPVLSDNFFSHFFDQAEDGVKREWLGDSRQRGSSFASGRPSGQFVMTRAEAKKSPSAYRTKKEAAEKAGQSLLLID